MQNIMKLSFTIPGTPIAKARGRMVPLQQCKKCGRKTARRQCSCGSTELSLVTVLNTPTTETVHYENLVKLVGNEAMQAAGIIEPVTETLQVNIAAFFPMPESRRCGKGHSLSERNGCKRLHDNDRHSQRPDCDNIAKAVLDGSLKVIYYDDSQIARLVVEKFWGVTPRCCVTVESLC